MFSREVRNTLSIAWPLLTGIFFIMVANGLQGTLLSLRADAEGFPIHITGLIMSAYYMGFLLGCILIPKFIASVGHIRVFAAFASLASTTILFHGIFIDPLIWGIIRAIGGFAFVGLFVVAESWLNSIAPNKLRAQIFGSYLLVVHGGLFGGQFLINLVSITQIELFILVSVLVSVSLIPITLANRPAPLSEGPEHLSLKALLSFSSLSLACVFNSGLAAASILTMGPIFAQQSGFGKEKIALFMGSYILGATIFPILVGFVSDRIERRKVIMFITFAGFLVFSALSLQWGFGMILIFIAGGLAASLYSVSIAYVHDRLKPEQITSASATLILLNGAGCSIGPLTAGFLMGHFGKNSLFIMLSAAFCLTLVIAVYKAILGKRISLSSQKPYMAFPTRSSAMLAEFVTRKGRKLKTGIAGRKKNREP